MLIKCHFFVEMLAYMKKSTYLCGRLQQQLKQIAIMDEKVIYLVQEQVIENETRSSHTFMRGCFDSMDLANKRIDELNRKHKEEECIYKDKEYSFGMVGKTLVNTYFIYVMEMELNK